jgi:hypothetical protein
MYRAVLVGLVCGCASAATPAPANSTAAGAPSCIADGLGTLHDPPELDTACAAKGASCRAACEAGDPSGCMLYGYTLQHDHTYDLANAQFARACTLGLAIGCTNFGAGLWLGHRSASPPAVACARKLFERSCGVRESFDCGMLARMRAVAAKTPQSREAARLFFEETCTDLGAMTCRMYAYHLERGDLGTAEPATIHALMQRACDTGDSPACGEHATVAETFKGGRQ